MKYLILKNKPRGVLIDRTPSALDEGLRVEFSGLPEGEHTVAFVFTSGRRCYRKINDGAAILESRYIGDEGVSVVVKNADYSEEWICERLVCYRGIVMPDISEVSKTVTDLLIELDSTNTELSALREDVEEYRRRIEEIYDGYDLI